MSLDTLREKLAARLKRREAARRHQKKARERLAEARKDVRQQKGAIHKLREYIKHLIEREREAVTVMYDSTTVSAIPADARAAAGYVGGAWPTFANGELRARCPHAKLLSIAVASRYDADCLDIEPGDSTPALAPGWVKRQKARGVKRPVVYASASTMPEVLAVLRANGIARSEVRIWTAHYNFRPHLCGTGCGYLGNGVVADATQWTDASHGRNLDESLLSKSFFS